MLSYITRLQTIIVTITRRVFSYVMHTSPSPRTSKEGEFGVFACRLRSLE